MTDRSLTFYLQTAPKLKAEKRLIDGMQYPRPRLVMVFLLLLVIDVLSSILLSSTVINIVVVVDLIIDTLIRQ